MATVSLKCKECGGVLEVDADREVLSCPYCGSKELFLESDEVKIERIRLKAYTDVELGRSEHQLEKNKDDNKFLLTYLKWLFIFLGIMLAVAVLGSLFGQ